MIPIVALGIVFAVVCIAATVFVIAFLRGCKVADIFPESSFDGTGHYGTAPIHRGLDYGHLPGAVGSGVAYIVSVLESEGHMAPRADIVAAWALHCPAQHSKRIASAACSTASASPRKSASPPSAW
jgi:hypothetical protein